MGILSDRYRGTFAGHRIEVVHNNVNRTLTLVIDDQRVATQSRMLPHDVTLSGVLFHDGAKHSVVAHSTVRHLVGPAVVADIEVDGIAIALLKVQ